MDCDTTLHVYTAGGGKGYTLHVLTATGTGKEYTLHVHINGVVERDTPCISKPLAVESDTPCTSIDGC